MPFKFIFYFPVAIKKKKKLCVKEIFALRGINLKGFYYLYIFYYLWLRLIWIFQSANFFIIFFFCCWFFLCNQFCFNKTKCYLDLPSMVCRLCTFSFYFWVFFFIYGLFSLTLCGIRKDLDCYFVCYFL